MEKEKIEDMIEEPVEEISEATDEEVNQAVSDNIKKTFEVEDNTPADVLIDALSDDVKKDIFVATNKKESIIDRANAIVEKLEKKGTSKENIVEYLSQVLGVSLKEASIINESVSKKDSKGFIDRLYDTIC